MPAKFGTFGINPIYNGEYKIGKIYNGINLVYSSGDPKSTILDTQLIKTTMFFYSGTLSDTYRTTTDTTAVEGTSYYSWDIPSQSFIPLSLSVGETVPVNSYTINPNSSQATAIQIPNYVNVIGFTENINIGEKLVLNGDDLGYYNGAKYNLLNIRLYDYITTSLSRIEIYNFPEPTTEFDSVSTESGNCNITLNGNNTINVSDIILKDAYVAMGVAEASSIGSNVTDGVNITIKGNKVTKLSGGMLGFGWTGQNRPTDTPGGGLYKIKSFILDTPNLVEIGAYSLVVNYDNFNTTGYPKIYVPQSVRNIGAGNSALYYSNSINDNVYNIAIKDSNNRFVALNTNTAGTKVLDLSDTSIIGIAGVSYTNTTLDHGAVYDVLIPNHIKYISGRSINAYSSSNLNITLNSNLEYYPSLSKTLGLTSMFEQSNPIIYSVTLGSNVTFIPPKLFNGSSTFKGGITFNQPANTAITIGDDAFYYKSARAVNIYYHSPNSSITGYDWSTEQNVTATFVEL